ncbi:MAG: DEAD/DEAH box helicase [Desulfobacterales bacterium]|nr:DEAD/DEAH box helicase [Desulfobacterales bacterium]
MRPEADAALKEIFAGIGVPVKGIFTPDQFQLEAISAIERTDCLVTAPTGAGKTWIAEQAIWKIYQSGRRSWYASPLKALTNSKYNEFSNIFGRENIGILTGDRKENLQAPIIVGTTEILRNQLYDSMCRGETLSADLVVLDEAHFLGDEDRGVVWEETMIYLPARIPLLLLSATIGNARQIAGWLSSIRKKECVVVEASERPVPLYPLFFHPSGRLLPLLSEKAPHDKPKIHHAVHAFTLQKHAHTISSRRMLPPFGKILLTLKKYSLLPAIFFLKSRADCDKAIDLCEENLITDPDQRNRIRDRIHELVSQSPYLSGHRQIRHMENFAVGAHHSGQLPVWKLIVEQLMVDGLLDAVFATSTVAAGVNFPARTVAFLNSDQFNGREFAPLTSTQFHQMTGRAGRRGMDKIGFALVLSGKFMDVKLIAKLVSAPPSGVFSQIKINFSMVLNLLLSHSPEQIKVLLKKSFAAYLIRGGIKNLPAPMASGYAHKVLWRDFSKHLNFLKEKNYVSSTDELTFDGLWASQLRVDHPLMIAEGFRLELFPDSDPVLLAAVMASCVSEDESEDKIHSKFSTSMLFKSFRKVEKGLKVFFDDMIAHGFEVRRLNFRPAIILYAWAKGLQWEKVVAMGDIAEGNLAMLILRTADNLRHIRALENAFPKAAQTADQSIALIMRDPVTMAQDL